MPRRIPALPPPRLQRGARRMEPDGALLQFHPRPQHPRLRALCRLHGSKTYRLPLPARSCSLPEPHSARSGEILDEYPVPTLNQPHRTQSTRIANNSCPASTRKEIYFEREAWTGQITLESLGKIDLRENAQRDANPSWRCAGRRQFPAASHERRTEKRLPETGRNAVPPSRCTNGWVNSRLARGVIA